MREVLSLATSPGGGGGGDGPPPANDNQTVDDSNNNDSVVIAEDSGNSSGDFMSSVGSECDDGSSCAEDVTKSEDSASLEAPAAPIDTASAPEPVKMLSSQPGYLELGEDRAKELLSDRPIEELYEVEDQPFARGKYATVRRCRCRRTGQQFAAKVVRKRRRSTDLRAEILHEVAVLDACRGCPRIVRLHRVFESPSDMVLLLELAAGGELQMVLDRDEVPEEREAARLMRQILHGLVFLHDINVAHLDLKPQNLVLTGDFPDCDVKLCDFGISRYLSQGADVREILGTPDYVAPEVLNYEPISLATDMWSVGVLLYVLLTGCSPFGGETKQETFCNISQCRLDFPDDLFEDVSDDAKDLMRKLIVKDPKRRLSANDCLQHQWFTAQPSPLAAQPVLVAGSPCASPTLARRHSVAATPSPPSSPPPSLPPPLPATPPPNVAATPLPQAPPRRGSLDWRRHRDSASVDRDRLCLSGPAVRRLASADSLDSLDRLAPARAHSTPHRSGISDVRRDTFLRNMESIARRLSVPGEADTAARAADTAESSDRTFRTRATGMQTMPLRGVRGVARAFEAFEASAQVTAHGSPRCAGTVAHPGLAGLAGLGLTASAVDLRSDKEAVFKFRKVFVLEDEDLDALTHLPSINGSTGSASSGSSVYSDTSISDSNSDTVSELSVDSSSDRSSIISLDPDDQYPWDVAYARFGLGRLYHPSYNVWERARPSGATRLLPRECNGSFARALSRFATESDESGRSKTSSRTAPDGMRQRPGLGGLSKPVLSKLALMQTAMSNGKRCGLELMREKNGNLVVIREIREVKPGGRYARFSEVKCESVQSRIRKLQVQGAKS